MSFLLHGKVVATWFHSSTMSKLFNEFFFHQPFVENQSRLQTSIQNGKSR